MIGEASIASPIADGTVNKKASRIPRASYYILYGSWLLLAGSSVASY